MCRDELGFAIVELFGLEQVDLVLDDTIVHRTGKKVAIASMHAGPLLKKKARGPLFMSYGHVFVVLAVHVRMACTSSREVGPTPLSAMPARRVQGQRGRPRVHGQRIASPRDWAEANPQAFKTLTVEMYGRQVTVEVGSFLGMAYKSLPGRLLRHLVVPDPSEVYPRLHPFR